MANELNSAQDVASNLIEHEVKYQKAQIVRMSVLDEFMESVNAEVGRELTPEESHVIHLFNQYTVMCIRASNDRIRWLQSGQSGGMADAAVLKTAE